MPIRPEKHRGNMTTETKAELKRIIKYFENLPANQISQGTGCYPGPE